MSQPAYGDVPLLDPETGRFPDDFAPPSVAADMAAAQAAAEAAQAAADASHITVAYVDYVGWIITRGAPS